MPQHLQCDICIISSAYPLRGGIANFTESLAETLSASQKVVIHSYRKQYPNFLFPGKTQIDSSPPSPRINALTIFQTIHSFNPFSWKKSAKCILEQNPKTIIFAYFHPFFAISNGWISRYIKRRNPKIKIIALVHNVHPNQRMPFAFLLTKYFFVTCDSFISLTHSVADQIKSFVPSAKICEGFHPLYNQFGDKISQSESRSHLGLDPKGKYILFFGIIRPYKGLKYLLQAMKDERLIERDIRLIIAGESYMNNVEYSQQIEDLGIHDRVVFHNYFIPNQKVQDYFSASDLLVQPYSHVSQSGILSIAMHFELPAIVTKSGGLSERIKNGETGYCIEQSPKAIADSIVDYFDNNRHDEFSRSIAKEKTKYTWEKLANQIIDFATK